MAEVFISYSRKDTGFVERLSEALRSAGRDVWVDVEGIRASEDWKEKIFREIDEANTFLFVVSPDSIQSEIANEEVSRAALNSKRMIPLFHREVADGVIPKSVSRFQGISFSQDSRFDAAVRELLKTLDTDLSWVRAHTRLLIQAQSWDQKRDGSLLLRGRELAEAERMLAKNAASEPSPTKLQSEYVLASRKAATRTQRIVIGAVLLALAVAVALAVVAWLQRNEADRQRQLAKKNEENARDQQHIAEDRKRIADERRQEAERQANIANSRHLASVAVANADERLDLASLLALEAVRMSDTLEARSALQTTYLANPPLLVYLPHQSAVKSVAFSPNGRSLATGSADGTVQLWDVANWKKLGPPLVHGAPVDQLAFSPDGSVLASAGRDVNLWRTKNHSKIGTIRWAENMAFSLDGRTIAAPEGPGKIGLWDVQTVRRIGDLFDLGTKAGIGIMAFSPDGKLLASVAGDNEIRLSDIETRKVIAQTREAHHNVTLALSFIGEGKVLVTGSYDNTIRFWDVAGLQPLGKPVAAGIVHRIASAPNGHNIAVASFSVWTERSSVELWDVANRAQTKVLMQLHPGQANDLAYAPNGKLLAVACDDGSVRIFDLIRTDFLLGPLKGHEDKIWKLAVSRDGRKLASGAADGTVQLWDLHQWKPLPQPLQGHKTIATEVAFAGNDRWLVSGDSEGQVVLWNLDQHPPQPRAFPHPVTRGQAVGVNPAGTLLAIAEYEGAIHLFGLPGGKEMRILSGGKFNPQTIAFGHKGRLLACATSEWNIDFWDITAGKLIGHMPVPGAGVGGIEALVFSPDDTILASGGQDHVVRLWNVANRRQIGEPLHGHGNIVRGVAFSPDGKLLASASWDGTARLWDVATRQPIGSPMKSPQSDFAGNMWDVAFLSPNLLATAHTDGSILVWDINPESWAARVCRLANRNLSPKEWQQYVGSEVPYHRTCPDLPIGEGVKSD